MKEKRVLVISYTALIAASANGRTMQSLLQGIPRENISLFCCYGVPDKGSCGSCYKVSNKDALRSLVDPINAGRIINTDSYADFENKSNSDARKGKKSAWKYLVKELVWMFGGWNNARLKEWIKEQKPDCIVYMYGNQSALQRLAVSISKKQNIPLIVYSCEDYCFKNYNYIDRKQKSFAFWAFQKITDCSTKKLFDQTAGLITNSDRLGLEYRNKYRINNVSTVMMASQMEFIKNGQVKEIGEISVDYLGALGYYRVRALMEIGEALQKIDNRLKLNVYGRIDNEELQKKLESCKGIRYHGFVSYNTVQKVMRNSTLLIEAINDDSYVNKNKRFGFSTKYADCFACGTPLLVYASEAIIETEFAKEHACAFVATRRTELVDVLEKALFDAQAREEVLEAARIVTQEYFDREKNIYTVNSMILGLMQTKKK